MVRSPVKKQITKAAVTPMQQKKVRSTMKSKRYAIGTAAEESFAAQAATHLKAVDPRFTALIAQHGLIEKIPQGVVSAKDAFPNLLKTIVYQQLAGKAAATIHGRVLEAIGTHSPTPKAVLGTEYSRLRGAGLSDRKASYILDLANHFADGRLSEPLLESASDEEILSALTAVKGIGAWSCQMFMMFTLGRYVVHTRVLERTTYFSARWPAHMLSLIHARVSSPDVLPTGDLGVQKGMAKFFGLGSKLPKPAEMEALAENWKPFRSYGTAYMWRCQDQKCPD